MRPGSLRTDAIRRVSGIRVRLSENVVWAFGVSYLLAVTGLAVLLILIGYLIHGLPGPSARAERWYAGRVISVLDTVLRPLDALPQPVEPR